MQKKQARAIQRAEDKIKADARVHKAEKWAEKCKLITPVMKRMNKTKLKVPTFKQIRTFLKQQFKLSKSEMNKITVILPTFENSSYESYALHTVLI